MTNEGRSGCLSCEIVSGRRSTLGGVIHETHCFHAHQDVAYPVPGLVIVASKRHLRALDEMRDDEASELLPLLKRIRSAQRAVLGVDHTYYFYNEDTSHHFHFWMVPRYAWMARFGKSVQAVRPALRHAAEELGSPSHLESVIEAAAKLRAHLSSSDADGAA